LTTFLKGKEDALSPIVYKFGQVGKAEGTLLIFLVLLAKSLGGEEKVAHDLYNLPITLSLGDVEFLHFAFIHWRLF
jgi:hypothetical protein